MNPFIKISGAPSNEKPWAPRELKQMEEQLDLITAPNAAYFQEFRRRTLATIRERDERIRELEKAIGAP